MKIKVVAWNMDHKSKEGNWDVLERHPDLAGADMALLCEATGIPERPKAHGLSVIDGRPLRIVVVGQEMGWPKGRGMTSRARKLSPNDRSEIVIDRIGGERRFYADGEHAGRNPHMRGTTSALRVIFGKGLGTAYEDEIVRPLNGRPFHIFDGFALVNRLLCSAGPVGSSVGRFPPAHRIAPFRRVSSTRRSW